MNRKLVLLNVALLALALALAWTLRVNWFGAQTRQLAVIQRTVPPRKLLAPPSPTPVKPVAAADYLDVAAKMLFSKDRNPTVVIEPPPAKPEPPMPALPNYHGQMAIGEPIAFLSTSTASQRGYHAGETIGDFTLRRFDHETIEFEWKGKSVERKLDALRPKEVAQAAASRPAAAPVPAPNMAAAKSVALGGSSGNNASSSAASDDPMFGPAQADGTRGCVPSDTSPSGTVHTGYRKNMTVTLFGVVCHWEQQK